MENKTCGECKHMSVDCLYCKNHLSTLASRDQVSPLCGEWEPKTNGDIIRQMSDEELAELLTNPPCFICSKGDAGGECTDTWVKKNCKEAIIVRLNAPAESQLNDAIQNVIKDGAKTAIDIHEAAYAPDTNVGTMEENK